MRFLVSVTASIACLAFSATPASAETYEEYLSRLRVVCEVDCKEPRDFRRSARKRDSGDESDMAVIMDVLSVQRVGNAYQLLSMDLEYNPLEERAILGSAGINTSSSNGIGGLPGARRIGSNPDLIIIEMDDQTFFDILNVSEPLVEGAKQAREEGADGEEAGIVVEGDRDRELIEPSLATLRSYFRNRRIVVRGQPRLEPVLVGARRDFRRKQVTLVLDDADEIVLLPRYDENGEPVIDTR